MLFHLINKSCCEQCHIQTVLKAAKSFAHAMILALLPFLQWKYLMLDSDYAKQAITKWFNPAAQSWVVDVYWDPNNKCIKNTSDKMLDLANTDTDNLYWAMDRTPL